MPMADSRCHRLQETGDQGRCHGKPGEVALVGQRDAWNRLHQSECGFSRDFASGQFDRDGADN